MYVTNLINPSSKFLTVVYFTPFLPSHKRKFLVRLLAGGGLGALPGGQGLLGAEDCGGPPERGLGEVLPVPLLHHQTLDLVQGGAAAGLHLGALEWYSVAT